MLRTLTLAAAASALLCAAEAGPAQLRGDSVVRYDDLDLTQDRDARLMLLRMERATSQACGGNPYLHATPGLITFMEGDYRDCREAALTNAIAALKAPKVSKLYAEKHAQEQRRIAGR